MLIATYPPEASTQLLAELRAAGHQVEPVTDIAALIDDDGWGLLVVELGEDVTAGLAFARRAKDATAVPVLIVAPRHHTITLGEAVCDDFVLAPVDPAELGVRVARLAASPAAPAQDEIVTFKDLALNLATYQATVAGTPVDLTYMEYELLRFFVTNSTRVWSREQLLSRVWGYDYFGGARTVDVHVRRLRAKLGEERASWIGTVRSVGYRFG
ncbi:MAG TPA: response regulator transcription factor [Acidimicrobiia bacterium]|nr:response regulator transcription factor [Acidimicrobiia bacterium]